MREFSGRVDISDTVVTKFRNFEIPISVTVFPPRLLFLQLLSVLENAISM